MNYLTRSARGLLVAVAALALTSGVVFAAQALPAASSMGTVNAAEHAAKTVPVVHATTPDTDSDKDAAKVKTADPRTGDSTTTAVHPDNHGSFVSKAANDDTLRLGFDSHGAYVSSIARSSVGMPAGATTRADRSAVGKAKAAEARAAAKLKAEAAAGNTAH